MEGLQGALLNVHDSVLGVINNTPMVKLGRSVPVPAQQATILAKLEMQNPGGSVKDRIAKAMIEEAEKEGKISPEKNTIVEITSGNTGIGLAMVCAAKGYKCIIIMPQLPTMTERMIICRKFGAQVHFTAAAKGVPGMQVHMDNLLASNPDYWNPKQFANQANPTMHYNTTGPEIWAQTGGKIDYLIAGAGTGGTITGAGKFLKEKNPGIRIIAVEPSESRVLVGQAHTKHTIVGIGPGIPLPFIEELEPGKAYSEGPRGIVDEFAHADSATAITFVDVLAAKEGLLVGPSSGAVMAVASQIATRAEAAGKTIVAIFPSSGIRYVTHPMWQPQLDEATAALPRPPDMEPEPLLKYVSGS